MKTGKVALFLLGMALVSACAIKATPYLWKSYEGPARPKLQSASGNVALHNEFLTLDGAGALYNGSSIYNEKSFNPQQSLRKLSRDGVELWRVAVQGNGTLRGILTDDGILVTNYKYRESNPGFYQVHIVRFSADGLVQWELVVGAADAQAGDVVYSDTGVTYVAYLECVSAYTDVAVMVAAIDATGELLWTRKIDTFAGPITAPDIALLADNRLFVTFDTRSYESPVLGVSMTTDGDIVSRQNVGDIGWTNGMLPLHALGDQVLLVGKRALISINEDGRVQWSQTLDYGSVCSAPKPDGIACFYPYANENGLFELVWYGLDGSKLNTAAVPWRPMQVVSNGNGKWVFLERFVPDDNLEKAVLSQFFDRFHVLSSAGVELYNITAEPGFGISGISEAEYMWQTWEAADWIEHFAAQGDRLMVAGVRGGPSDDYLRDNRIYVGGFPLD